MKKIASIFFPQWRHPLQTRGHHNALTQLAKWLYQFSPVIAFDAPVCTKTLAEDVRFIGLNLDLTGTERLFDHQTLPEQFLSYFSKQNLTARIAIAPTLGAAWAFSRYGLDQITIIAAENLIPALSSLSIQALRISKTTVTALKELHLKHIKQLLNLPRSSLNARFDPELTQLLDYALGNKQEPFTPLSFRPALKAVKSFDGPVTQLETVSLAAHMLLKQLLDQLHPRQEKAAKLVLKIKAQGLPLATKVIALSVPSAKEKHLWSLLQPYLETLQLGHGVEALCLTIPHTAPLRAKKQNYLEQYDTADDSHYGELIDTCAQYLGEQNVLQVEPRASYIPELSFRYVLPGDKRPKSEPPLLPFQRPSLLFYQPQSIRALAVLPDQPPFWLKWQGKKFPIQKSFGPERIAPEWWGHDDSLCLTRDYFRVQLPTGLWLWIFRELETSQWFVHGVWA